jgi:transposase-like protein
LCPTQVTATTPIDQTYVKRGSQWNYLYRAIDSNGDTVVFWLSRRHNLTPAKRLLRKGLKQNSPPARIVIDGSQTNCQVVACRATQQVGCASNQGAAIA